MASSSPSVPTERLDLDDDLGAYRAVSGLAVAGLIVGVCSVMAFIHPLLWLVPLAGIVLDALALRQIAEASSRLIGRKAALVGLAISLVCGTSAPIQAFLYRRAMQAQAIEIADEWFNSLRENRPELAFRLSQHPTSRAARVKSPIAEYLGNDMMRDSLRSFIRQSPNALLLKLGRRGHVRLYQNEDVWSDQVVDGVRDIYVVTVGQDPTAVSFFIRLGTTRSRDLATGEWQWQVSKNEFVTMPSSELLDSLGG